MATNSSFSPKEWIVLIRPQTEWGETEAGEDMYQLDVDSVSMPSLGLNQSFDLKNGSGRTFKDEDVFQDNKMTVREMTFSGDFHTDSAHKYPFLNLSNQATSNDTVPFAAGHQPQSLGNGVSISAGTMASHHLFTIAIAAPDTTNAKNMLFHNCVCTNFQISADIGTDGGRYKYSATFSTGGNYQALANQTSVEPSASYLNTTNVTMGGINASTLKVADINATLNSFSVTVDFPAIWTGAGSLGYEVVNRAQECSITFDAQVKYDNLTDELIHTFDGQSAAVDGVGLNIVNSANFDIAINDYILTNVAFNEDDLMMLDISGKALDDGSEALLVLDWAS